MAQVVENQPSEHEVKFKPQYCQKTKRKKEKEVTA
jgi:hypothetical protein